MVNTIYNGCQETTKYTCHLEGGIILDAPYGQANLPILGMSDEVDTDSSLWTQCFAFNATDTTEWTSNIRGANNQKLVSAQRELLLWHQKLAHACLTTVHNLCRQKKSPKVDQESDLLPICEGPFLLKGTMDKGLIMSLSDKPCVDCYPDADFAGLYGYEDVQDPHFACSRTDYAILAFGCPVLWSSHLQTELALGTMEAEYVAMSSACKDLFPVVDVIRELSKAVGLRDDFDTNFHIKVHEDNVGALTLGRLEPGRMTP